MSIRSNASESTSLSSSELNPPLGADGPSPSASELNPPLGAGGPSPSSSELNPPLGADGPSPPPTYKSQPKPLAHPNPSPPLPISPTLSIRSNASESASPSSSELNPPLGAGDSGDVGDAGYENFSNFFKCWLAEQDGHLQELISASRDPPVRGQEEERLRPLINRVLRHYEQYYRVKSTSAKHDVLLMFSPSWTSSLESALLWIGGWRPTMAFHLLYSKSGLQLEAQLADILRGLGSGDLGDLSPRQIARVDEMQRGTIKEETEISEKMAKLQESMADSTMVELSQAATEKLLSAGEGERVDAALRSKKEKLEALLESADDLRLRTLRGVIHILEPLQAVHFFIAGAELHLRVHEWGKRGDELRRGHPLAHEF